MIELKYIIYSLTPTAGDYIHPNQQFTTVFLKITGSIAYLWGIVSTLLPVPGAKLIIYPLISALGAFLLILGQVYGHSFQHKQLLDTEGEIQKKPDIQLSTGMRGYIEDDTVELYNSKTYYLYDLNNAVGYLIFLIGVTTAYYYSVLVQHDDDLLTASFIPVLTARAHSSHSVYG